MRTLSCGLGKNVPMDLAREAWLSGIWSSIGKSCTGSGALRPCVIHLTSDFEHLSVLFISDLCLEIICFLLVCFMKAQIRQESAHPSHSGEDASLPSSVPTHGEYLTRSESLVVSVAGG
jgi:hypothetical protein